MAQPIVSITVLGDKKVIRTLSPQHLKRAVRNAVNTTSTVVKRESAVEAAKEWNIKIGRIKKSSAGNELIRRKRARAGETEAKVYFGTERKGDRAGLQHWSSNRQMVNRKKPPTVKLRKGGPKRTVERGFFATARTARGLYQREGKSAYPIHRRTGPSTKQMVEDKKVMSKVEIIGVKALEKKMADAMEAQWRKAL